MTKKSINIVVLLILLIVIVSILGIFLYNKEHNIDRNSKVEESISIEDFKNKLEEKNIEIEEENKSDNPGIIGASEGVTYVISNEQIQIYKFDLNSTEELTKSNIKKAKEEGKTVLPEFDNHEIKVIYNKGMILTNYEDHPQKDEIVEAFESL